MPRGIAPPIPPSVLDLPKFDPVFTPLTVQTLGNAATNTDGYDSLMAALASAASAQPSVFAALDSAWADVAIVAQAIDSAPTEDIDQEIAQAMQSAGPGLDLLGAQVGALLFNPTQVAGIPPAPKAPTFSAAGLGPVAGGSGVGIGAIGLDAQITGATEASITAMAATDVAAGIPISGALMTASVVVPIVGAAVAVGLLLLHYLGGGCGTACTDAARAEQIYEAAADNLYNLAHAGFITVAQAVYGMQQWITAGTQHMARFGTQQARTGAANLTRVISAEILATRALPPVVHRAMDINAARKLYVMSGNWYFESLQAAAELTDTYLQHLTG